jgi:hypothetical protein
MLIVEISTVIISFALCRLFYVRGIRAERQERLRRVAALRKLIGG